MTELELMELLGNLDTQYILEAQALRTGQLALRKKDRQRKIAVRSGAVAALLAVTIGAGAILKPYLEKSWVRPAEVEAEQLPGETEDNAFFQSEGLPEDFLAILENRETFLFTETDTDMTLSDYTEYLREEFKNRDCGPVSFGLADIDRDGAEELIVRYHLLWEDCGLLILDRGEGRITGWAEKSDILPDTQWELLPEGEQSVLVRRQSDITLPVTKWENGAWTEQTEDFFIACAQTDEWSTYLPNNDEWVMLVRSMSDREASIVYTKEPDIKFAVRDLGEKTQEECVQWAEGAYREYNPSEGKDGSISGERQGAILSIRFVQNRSGVFALVGTCPERETDGLGVYIKMMFDYFRVEMYPPTTLLGTWELYGDVTKKNETPEVTGYTFYANMTGQAILSTGEARPFAYAVSNGTLELRFFSGDAQRLPYRREQDELVLTQDYQEVSYYWQTRGELVYDWMVGVESEIPAG